MNGYNISGFVFYEADCFGSCVNPFVPSDVPEPSIAQKMQKPIKVTKVAIFCIHIEKSDNFRDDPWKNWSV